MDSASWSSIFIFLFLLLASAFFSSAETAYTSMNRIRMGHEAKKGDRRAKKALSLANQYDKLLSTILIGNNTVNIGASAVATIFFVSLTPTYGPAISTVATTLIFLIFGEITPKLVAKLLSASVAKSYSGILNLLMTILSPIIWLLTKWQEFVLRFLPRQQGASISEAELLSLMNVAHTEGSIEEEEHNLLKSAILLDDTEAYTVLTPRIDVDSIDIDDSYEEIEAVFETTNHTRLVVFDDETDTILGTLHERDFNRHLKKQRRLPDYHKNLGDIISKPTFVPGNMNLSDLLKQMQMEKKHLVIVVDERGSMDGIVTMEDIIEKLVGDIWDEHDIVQREIEEVEPGQIIHIQGSLPLEDLFNYFNLEDPDRWDSISVGGLIMEELGRMPENNDEVILKYLHLKVVKVLNGRILDVLVKRLEPLEIEDDQETN